MCFWDAEAATNTQAERFVWEFRPMVWQTRGRMANARIQENDDALGQALARACDKGYTVRYNQLSPQNRHRTLRDHHGNGDCQML